MRKATKLKGFTLIEMLLVMVIISMIIFTGINYLQQETLVTRQDKVSLQMQQVLNAALAYYVANGTWPASVACLQGTGGGTCSQVYLPSVFLSPWNQPYTFVPGAGAKPGYVYTSITAVGVKTKGSAAASANVIAGKLPLAYTTAKAGNPPPAVGSGGTACTVATTTCFVVASANVPGQNLNNATGVNFAGIYHHGGCVPVPVCPVDANGNTMTPQVFVVPVSVSGVNDTSNAANVYPISSFTAYAVGPGNPPGICNNGSFRNCTPTSGPAPLSYWRACLQITTVKGDVSQTRTDLWGYEVTLAAFTRCSVQNETSGSSLFVFTK